MQRIKPQKTSSQTARFLLYSLQAVIDAVLFYSCMVIMPGKMPHETRAFLTGTMLLFFMFGSMYGFRNWTFRDEMKKCLRSGLIIFLVSVLFFYTKGNRARLFSVVLGLSLFIPLDLAVRYLYRRLLFRAGLAVTSVIILGAGEAGELFAQNITKSPFTARKVLCFLDDNPAMKGRIIGSVPVLGAISEFGRVQDELKADEAVIAIPTASRRELSGILGEVEERIDRVMYIPDMYMLTTMTAKMRSIDGMPVITSSQGLLSPVNMLAKNIIDYVGGTVALLLASFIMLPVAWLIKRHDGGSVLFYHGRVGRELKPFRICKFRTMVPNAEAMLQEMLKDDKLRAEFEESFKFRNDPRITPLGKFLRKSSLDELPQLFNVLKGEMSLVGPRPIVQKEVELYYGYRTARQIFRVKPGMTGYWQVNGRNDVENYQQRIDFDLYYIHNWSVWLDIVIMIRTFRAVFKGSGAY